MIAFSCVTKPPRTGSLSRKQSNYFSLGHGGQGSLVSPGLKSLMCWQVAVGAGVILSPTGLDAEVPQSCGGS